MLNNPFYHILYLTEQCDVASMQLFNKTVEELSEEDWKKIESYERKELERVWVS
ncbi:hypothetical protein [Staphylococcus capitis]|uniref:hypothetical protein n=1 Tax=Staphylococcus capitis TaxID=29388 RepID=UPI003CF89819